ncbi:HEAT repeat domain-containing protein [Arsenicicoccus sp. oral taxon 190]|uniref:HEAT repeat domain-containing protein n=1 Tax=Arsenicicoccus sp. oral taxon 190 TaxID=1658671 RepID=UPI000679F856|nr:HEAT repeat domain-containing protein [Arsenicicoccus sp. oral taxon 190]AKT52377.1 hypothetical protein ADJ73_15840 [Arsenicicoccus sp. oral taxon 190]
MIAGPAWLSLQLLTIGLTAVLASCGVLASLVASTKGLRLHRRRQHDRHLAPYRPALLQLAAGDDDPDALDLLRRVPARSWPVVQEAIVGFLGKVKGETAHELVEVLDEHEAIARAREDATSRRAVARGRAAVLLGRCGRPEGLPTLLRLLQDRDPLVRQSAATAVGQFGDPEGAAPILRAVRGDHGRAGLPSSTAVDALLALRFGIEDALRSSLRDPDPGVRAVAALVVAERTSVAARPTVRELLLTERDPQVQVALCRALGRLGDAGDVPMLVDAATSGGPQRRGAAVAALGELDAPASVPVLRDLLADPDRRLAARAAQALADMQHPDARRALAELTDGPQREAAAYVLALQELREGKGEDRG